MIAADRPQCSLSTEEEYNIAAELHGEPRDRIDEKNDVYELNDGEKERLDLLLDKYKGIFLETDNKLGLVDVYEHNIDLIPGAVPCNNLPYRKSPEQQELFERHCEDLVKQGVLEKTNTGPWSSRSFLVQKANKKWRLVSDFRYLNENIVNKALGAPRADDALEMIGDMRPTVFSKLDAAQGFFQIPLKREDRKKNRVYWIQK